MPDGCVFVREAPEILLVQNALVARLSRTAERYDVRGYRAVPPFGTD